MTRDGFYWVKRCGQWIVARANGEFWWLAGSEKVFHDYNFEEIGPEISPKGR